MKIKVVSVLLLLIIALASFCGCKKKEENPKKKAAEVSVSQNQTDDTVTEEENHDFSFLFGTWRLVSGTGLNTYVFDDKGNWVSYNDDGEIYHKGNLKVTHEYEDLHRYDLCADDGTVCYSFYMDSDTIFHIGNEGENVYQKITR